MKTMEDRLAGIRNGIDEACRRAGRDSTEVGLVAVAKTYGPDVVAEAGDLGVRIMGENRVQEAAQKIPLCPGYLDWHLIGHLQSNKVRMAVDLFSMIHSVDSLKILDRLEFMCREAGKRMPICIQVNVSGEGSKSGIAPSEGIAMLEHSCGLHAVTVVGLMTIPPFTPDPEEVRPHFARLRELRDAWRKETGVELEHLSMGMSRDYTMAIEEGATLVRIGSALFGPRGGRQAWSMEHDV